MKKTLQWFAASLWLGTLTGLLTFPFTFKEGLFSIAIGTGFWLGTLVPMLASDD